MAAEYSKIALNKVPSHDDDQKSDFGDTKSTRSDPPAYDESHGLDQYYPAMNLAYNYDHNSENYGEDSRRKIQDGDEDQKFEMGYITNGVPQSPTLSSNCGYNTLEPCFRNTMFAAFAEMEAPRDEISDDSYRSDSVAECARHADDIA